MWLLHIFHFVCPTSSTSRWNLLVPRFIQCSSLPGSFSSSLLHTYWPFSSLLNQLQWLIFSQYKQIFHNAIGWKRIRIWKRTMLSENFLVSFLPTYCISLVVWRWIFLCHYWLTNSLIVIFSPAVLLLNFLSTSEP